MYYLTYREQAAENISESIRLARMRGTNPAVEINRNYPFGERRGRAYQVWLEERRKAHKAIGVEFRRGNATQMHLFPLSDPSAPRK